MNGFSPNSSQAAARGFLVVAALALPVFWLAPADDPPSPEATTPDKPVPATAYQDVIPATPAVPLALQPGYEPPARPPVDAGHGWHESPEALVAAVVSAAAGGDAAALAEFRVTELEHERLLWPWFESSDPARNVPHGFAYTNLDNRSRKGQRALAQGLQDGPWTVETITHTRPDDVYTEFVLHPGTVVALRAAGDRRHQTQLLGSVVEFDGRFKLLSYREP